MAQAAGDRHACGCFRDHLRQLCRDGNGHLGCIRSRHRRSITGENDGGCKPRLIRLIQAPLSRSEPFNLPVLKRAIFIEATDQVAPRVRRFLLAQSGRA
jgi:hypothetical protein